MGLEVEVRSKPIHWQETGTGVAGVLIQLVAVAFARGGGTIYPASSAASAGSLSPTTTWALMAIVLIGLLGALAWVSVIVKRRRLVNKASLALNRLDELNSRSRALVPIRRPVRLAFHTAESSKARFDRVDLPSRMKVNILEREPWVEREIKVRISATWQFAIYLLGFEALAHESLGKSSHPRVSDERFAAIERKVFQSRKLAYPTPKAHVATTVTYTSPKGQNSYSRKLEWNFDQLRRGLQDAQATRALQSTAEALRQRERSLMNPGLRMKILRRDDFRCKMCGASASDGTSLHIDHIRPVSRGGPTVPENLQALCQPCNIGKSNTFIG